MTPSSIAIDGPVASGKSSVGKQLADKLGYLFFDTGIMYRTVTFLALRDNVLAQGEEAIKTVALTAHILIQPPTVTDGRDCTVTVEGEDITWEIRQKEVESNVSIVAAIGDVRRILTAQMRRIGLQGKVIMVGRDIGTVVMPDADLKIFLTASVEARARRRFDEAQARGETRSYDDILANLRERDRIDSSRALAPLKAAPDAVQLDTTDLDLPGVVAAIEQLIVARAA